MKELELKQMFEIFRIDWRDFQSFMVGKTMSTIGSEPYYYLSDIKWFIHNNYEISKKK